jgi:hypothetical protein
MVDRFSLHGRIFMNRRMFVMMFVMYLFLMASMVYHSHMYEGWDHMHMYADRLATDFFVQTLQIVRLEGVLFAVLILMKKNVEPHLDVMAYTVVRRQDRHVSTFAFLMVFCMGMMLFIGGAFVLLVLFVRVVTPFHLDVLLLTQWGLNMIAVMFFYALLQGLLTLVLAHSTATFIPVAVYWFAELNKHHLYEPDSALADTFYRVVPHAFIFDGTLFVNASIAHNMVVITVSWIFFHILCVNRPLL